MQAVLNEKKTEVTLTLPYNAKGEPSKKRDKETKAVIPGEGKSLVHFSTHGNVVVEIDGEQHQVGINGYSPNPNYKA